MNIHNRTDWNFPQGFIQDFMLGREMMDGMAWDA